MLKPAWVLVVVLLLLVPLSGCGGGDDDEREDEQAQQPVDGTFVGKLSGTDVLVAVVAPPAAKGDEKREATIYVSDGKRVSESFQGSIADNSFTAASHDDDAEAKGELAGDSVKGTIELPAGKSASYEATRATGASGLYMLTVSGKGTLSGASAAGVGLTSKSELRAPGTGALKFADGERRKFAVSAAAGDNSRRVRRGEVRLVVLPDGQMSGAGAREAGAEADYFIRSTRK
jgi:hypothetical protein